MPETPMNPTPENSTPVPENPSPTQTPSPSALASASFIAPHLDRIATQASSIKTQVVSQVTSKVATGIEQAKSLAANVSEQGSEMNFVTMETESDRIRRKNLHYVSAFIGFVWMLFHFTVVYFFGIELGSAILVGLFLGFGNLVSLVLDIPVGILQRYFYAKRLYLFAGFAMLGASLVFLKFIYASSLFQPTSGGSITTALGSLLDSGTNILLIILAATLYGFAKEVNDITTLSYILNNADPSEYSNIISKNNIFVGGGSLVGLVASGFILAFNPTVAVLVLITFVIILIGFMMSYFDNSERTIDFSAISKLKIIAKIRNVESAKAYAIGYLSKADFATAAKTAKFVFLKPMPEKAKFNLAEIVAGTKKEALLIRKVIAEQPFHFGMLWAASVVLIFGFWDTFATSFLIEHLVKISSAQMAYIILAIMVIPAFVMQDFFIGMSRKIGVLPVVTFGLVLSAGSLLAMAFFSSVIVFIALGIVNSLGYAAGMGVSQGVFLDVYNNFYAKKLNLTEIDSNASASPMKIIQNLANVIGLFVGGVLLAIFGFMGFFIVFGFLLFAGAVASVTYRKSIVLN
jgi:MFS family permease